MRRVVKNSRPSEKAPTTRTGLAERWVRMFVALLANIKAAFCQPSNTLPHVVFGHHPLNFCRGRPSKRWLGVAALLWAGISRDGLGSTMGQAANFVARVRLKFAVRTYARPVELAGPRGIGTSFRQAGAPRFHVSVSQPHPRTAQGGVQANVGRACDARHSCVAAWCHRQMSKASSASGSGVCERSPGSLACRGLRPRPC